MNYPLHIELDIQQDDFIQLEILQQAMLVDKQKKINKNLFLGESVLALVVLVAMLVLIARGTIDKISLLLPLVMEISFFANLRRGNSDAQRDYSYSVNHMLESREEHQFFEEEEGFAEFYEDRCEFLTNLERRYFGYENIKHIKVTRFLYIFVMKESKEKGLKGFEFMLIPRRNMLDKEDRQLAEICENIISKYDLQPWNDLNIVG